MMQRLFRTKSLEQLKASAEEPEHQLKKNLGAFDLTMFGIGAIIGAGIFSTIGTAAAGNMADGRWPAGPSLVLSILMVAVICGFTALAYAELASMIPVSGSAYTYAYATLGELMAWIIGWDLLLEYAVSNVAVAISWGDYARSFLSNVFHVDIPGWLAMDPRSALKVVDGLGKVGVGEKLHLLAQAKQGLINGAATFTNWEVVKSAPTIGGFPITINLLAVVITVLITWLVYIGIKESARANSIMVVIKVLILLAVVGLGLKFITPANWHPFVPHGFKGIQAGAAIIFFAFIGFDAVSTTAEECRNPGKDLPRGILWSLVICTVIYAGVALVTTGMVHYTKLGGIADPLSYIFTEHKMTTIAAVISFGAVIATTAALLVYQVGQPRIFMSMSRDGLLGPWFGQIHKKYGTPSKATILTGFIVAIPAALLNIDEVVELTNIGTLFAFAVVCTAVMLLRKRRPEATRKFVMPMIWVLAPMGILGCIWFAMGLPILTWIRFVIWLVLGLVIYFAYGARNSRLHNGPAEA
ncbi:MAG TPA: amino acid permease [Holophagaceae bacterium]|nr:amino acid permease [Holophagaceae bacterium]